MKILDFIKKYRVYIVLGMITFFAFSVRVWHFHDWLHFEMDQARDAELVARAVENGPGQLPLLGPRAAGTFLRLGPAFYYFQYLSGKIFGSVSPDVLAYPDLIFSVLAVPLFYFFLRLYFSRFSALSGAAIFAFGFIAIQYSRFAWNPNSIPFWTLVSLYGVVKALDEKRKIGKYLWIALAFIGLGVASQLHFITFLGVPAIFFLYFFWVKGWQRVDWKGIALASGTLLLFFLPMILSDIQTSGDNVRQFLWAIRNKPKENSLLSNLQMNAFTQARYYTTILTSYSSKTGAASLLAGGFIALIGFLKSFSGAFREKDEKKKNFLKMITVWSIVSFFILMPFAMQIRSRYMLFGIFLPIIFFSFFVEWLVSGKKYQRFAKSAALIMVFFVIALNTEATMAWYKGLSRGENPSAWNNRRLDIKQADGITLSQLEAVSNHIYEKWEKDPRKIYLHAKMQYRAPIAYLLESRNKKINVSFISYKNDDRSAIYFAATTAKNGYESVPSHYRAKFDVTGSQQFQQLAVFDLALKEIQPTAEQKKELQREEIRNLPSQTKRSQEKGLKRTERVLWENIF